MRTVAVFAMVLVIASLCSAQVYYEEHGPMFYRKKHQPKPDEDYHPQQYPEQSDISQVQLQQLVDLQNPRRDESYHQSIDSSEIDHLKQLMIDPTKPVKARPEHYWPELEDPNEPGSSLLIEEHGPTFYRMKHQPKPDEDYYPQQSEFDISQVQLQQLVDLQNPRRDESYHQPIDPSEMNHLKQLMIDPTKPVKARPEHYWPELEDPNEPGK